MDHEFRRDYPTTPTRCWPRAMASAPWPSSSGRAELGYAKIRSTAVVSNVATRASAGWRSNSVST